MNEESDQKEPAAPFWTETPEDLVGRKVIDPVIAAAEELGRREAENPGLVTRAAAKALDGIEAVEDHLEEKLQPLDEAMDRAVDKVMDPLLQRLDKSSLVDRLIDWWLKLGKPKTDEGRVDAWVVANPEKALNLARAAAHGNKTSLWATAFAMVAVETPRGEEVDSERVDRIQDLILQRAAHSGEPHP